MTRPIGEVFEYEGIQLKVVKSDRCEGCHFDLGCRITADNHILGCCSSVNRSDHEPVMFVKVDTPSTPLISIKKKSIILNFK